MATQKRMSMNLSLKSAHTVQIIAAFFMYLVILIPVVHAQPTYEHTPPSSSSTPSNVSDSSSSSSTTSAYSDTLPTSPYGASDAEGAGGNFSSERGAYGVLLNLELPKKTNKRTLTVQGTTNSHTRVKTYLNPALPITNATSYHTITIADSAGAFALTFTLNEGLSHIVVIAEGRAEEIVDEATNQTSVQKTIKEFDVTVDTVAPVVSLDQHISIVEGVLALKGTTSETIVATITVSGAVSEQQLPAGAFDIRVPVSESVAQNIGKKTDVHFVFADEAGNTKQESKTIQILGPAPQLFSHNLNELNPSYTQKVTVRGNATPGAVVFVTVNDEVTPNSAWSTSLLDLVKSLSVRAAPQKEYTAVAGPDGRFSIDVLLTQFVQTNLTQYLPQQPLDSSANTFGRQYDVGSTFENRLQIFVVDDLGRSSTSGPVSVVFAKCGSGGFWEVEQSKITPSTVIPAHLRNGIAQLGFNVKLKWRGPADRATILSPPRFRVLHQSTEARRDYAFDPETLVRQPVQVTWSDDYTVGGIVVNFNQLPYLQKNLSDISAKKDLLIKIPLQMEVLFEYEDASGMGTGIPATSGAQAPPGTQYISGVSGRPSYQNYQQPLSPSSTSGVYGGRAGKITRTQLHCTDVVTTLDLELDERWLPTWLLKDSIHFFDDAIKTLNQILQYLKFVLIGTFVTCLGSFAAYYYKLVIEKLDCTGVYADAADSPEKQQCIQSRESRKDYERYMKWICDRVYCPAAPTLAVHITQASMAKTRALQSDGTTNPAHYDLGSTNADAKEAQCGNPGMNEGVVYDAADELLSSSSSSMLTPFSGIPTVPGASPEKQCAQEYINQWDSACWFTNELRQSECIYDTATKSSRAAQSCGGPIGQAVESASTICQEEVRPLVGSVRYGGTLPARDGTIEVTEAINSQPTLNKKRVTIRDRWFRLIADGQWELGTFYADRKERKDPATGEVVGYDRGLEQFVPEFPQKILTRAEAEKYGLVPRVNRDYVVDPTSSIVNSIRCMCLPAINTYIALIQRVFVQFRQCFQSILLTGEGSTGMCRRAFSETLCDFLIEAVKCFAQRYGAGSGGGGGGRLQGISGFFKAVSSAGEHMHTAISDRYGKSNLYSILNERSLIHSACFYAFTGDFDLDIEGALTGIGSVPVASEGFLYPKQTRRFMTSNPVTGNARFIYHLAGGLVAGSEITYGAELICTASPTNCKQIYGFANNKCDCAEIGEKRYPITNFMGTGVLAAGEYGDMDAYVPAELPYRFDRVRLYWQWRNNQGNFQTEEKIIEIQQIGDEPPLSCQFKLSGYQCEIAAGQLGRAAFLKRPRPVKSVFMVNEPIDVDVELEKYSPNNRAGTIRPDVAQALSLAGQQVPYFLMYQLRDQNGNVIPLERYAGSTISAPTSSSAASSAARSMAVRAIVEDGVSRFTIPSVVLTEDMITRGMYGGAAGYARTVAYTNPDFAEAGGNKLPLRSLPSIDVSYPSRENLAVGLLMFRTKDAAGRDAFCYSVQHASLSDDLAKLLEGSRNYQFEIVPGAIPCTDAELSASGLSPSTTALLKNNIYRFDSALGTISYHGLRIQPEYGSVLPGKLYADGIAFLAQQRAAATQCDDITAQNPVHWKLSLELRPCKTRFENDIPGPDTCIPGDAVARFGGKALEFTGADAIDIPVACSKVTATGELPACTSNAFVNQECNCVGTSTSSRCGIAQGLNYCSASGSCIGYEACTTTDKNNGLYVDPSNNQNICDCNGKLGGATDMECGFGNFCVPCPAPNSAQYACVSDKDSFVKNPAQAATLCAQRPASVPPVSPGPSAPGTGASTPTPGTIGPVISGPFTPQIVTLGSYGSVDLNPATACGPDDDCAFHARADTVDRPIRSSSKISSIVIHITAGSSSAYDTYKNIFFKGVNSDGEKVGTHFIIDRDGSMIQIEQEDIITYHAGCSANNPACAKPGINSQAIGIDLANYAGNSPCSGCIDVRNQLNMVHGKAWSYPGGTRYWEPFPDAQMKTLAKTVAEIMVRYGISIDHIYFHSTIGRPQYVDGTSGYSCEGFTAGQPNGVYGGHEDPGPLFDWCTFKATVLQAVEQYAAASPTVAAVASPEEAGAQYAGSFVERVSRICPGGITEDCLNTNKDFVLAQDDQYRGLCTAITSCTDAYDAQVDTLLGTISDVLLDLRLEKKLAPPAVTTLPTAADGTQLAQRFANDMELICLNGITVDCVQAHKPEVAAKVSAYAAQCNHVPECDNAFTRGIYTELGNLVAQRVDEIYGEVTSSAGTT
ncbi:MAG: N-acetylmuramoyl-L-alanine amidase [Candidatus Woesearchaeota archaeon]|nr:N-acetylmuramoyl-L-alanine amidase [Candidatus Woesearchaeota archaeon]